MCGFGGIINSNQNHRSADLEAIAKKVKFRGPDNTSVVIYDSEFNAVEEGPTGIFFNRLAIIDLAERANQPFEDEDCLLVFNGEIYNYQNLRTQLENKGVRFHTTSDTEVLFYLLKHYGTHAISKLNGMFSFCFINKGQKSFIVARDRLGIKPLYYKQNESGFVFGSELKSIALLSPEENSISSNAIQAYLALQYIPTPLTIYNEIKKLEPGHYIEATISDLSKGNVIESKEYWDAYTTMQIHSHYNVNDLHQLLQNSVDLHLQADVPVGLFLSSGVDSSLLAAILNTEKFKNRQFNFYTIAFDESEFNDESDLAERYLKAFGNRDFIHNKLLIHQSDIINASDSMYNYVDEPFGDSAFLLNYTISVEARKHVKVVLSGDGADELFWGYARYEQWRGLTNKSKTVDLLSRLYPAVKPFDFLKKTGTSRNRLERNPVNVYTNLVRAPHIGLDFDFHSNDQLWASRSLQKISTFSSLPALFDIKSYLPDCMNYKVDRSSMAASLEVRVPYMENAIIDFALQTPMHLKSTTTFSQKALLKQLLLKLAPHYSNTTVKKGFNFPLEKWLKLHWRENVHNVVSDSALDKLGIEKPPIRKMINEFYKGKNNASSDIWYLYNLVMWYQHNH
jgi:asparagine synthase (glutamine-hydrolysing)